MENVNSVVLLADRKGSELTPLDQFYPPALLPIAGKSPLEYWLEALCEQDIQKVYLVTGRHTKMIKEQFPNGDLWGIELVYLSSRGEESPSKLIERYRTELDSEMLVLRADILPNPEGQTLLSPAVRVDLSVPGDTVKADQLDWQQVCQTGASAPHLLREVADLPIVTNLILDTRMAQRTPRGIQVGGDNRWLATPNFSKERAEQCSGNLYIGREAMVHDKVTLEGNVSVEANCFIDRGATLNNAIVFPGSYVGQNISIQNSIVCGSLLIDLSKGVAQQISDPALISHIETASTLVRTSNTERLVAASMLLLTAPIAYPLAWLTKKRGEKLLARQEARSNRSSRQHPIEFECLSFNSSIDWVSRWPQLVNVMDGDLKLFGSEIETGEFEPPLGELPLSQGVYTAVDLFPNQELDEVERQLWGLELANENPGFWRSNFRLIKAMLLP